MDLLQGFSEDITQNTEDLHIKRSAGALGFHHGLYGPLDNIQGKPLRGAMRG